MDWVVKEKATGKIFSILCVSYGTHEPEYVISGGDGIILRFSEKKFRKKFEEFEVDFSHVTSVISELVKTNDAAQRLIFPLARRLHPGGYFKEGCLVYFQYSGYTETAVPEDMRREIYYGSYGNYETRMFIVLGLHDDHRSGDHESEREFGRIDIARYRGPGVPLDSYSAAYSLPICKSGFEMDAYYYLKRYDMPY